MITPYMKFNQNLRGRVLFQDFFGRSVVERPIGDGTTPGIPGGPQNHRLLHTVQLTGKVAKNTLYREIDDILAGRGAKNPV